jgi:segregation and condensation protein B
LNSLRDQVEAALFASRTPLTSRDLMRLLDEGPEPVELALSELRQVYGDREGALEIRQEGGGWIMGLRPQFYGTVRELIPVPCRDAILATLTHIAREQPVAQSTIVTLRGQKAYNHIHDLVELGWVTKKRAGNTYILRTTKKFSEVFHCAEDPAEIRRIIEESGIAGLGPLAEEPDQSQHQG